MLRGKESRDWQLWNDPEIVGSLDAYWHQEVFDQQKDHGRSALAAVRRADPTIKTLLDFGCGTGRYVPIAKELGFQYTGVDVTNEMLAVARKRYPDTCFSTDDIFESARPDASFDVVMSIDVIVHLPEFERPFATLYRLAKSYVVVKLCYLTKRKGIGRKFLPDPASYVLRNGQGFIEHFFNLQRVIDHIFSTHHPEWLYTDVFLSGQPTSDYQVVIVVGKAGAPRIPKAQYGSLPASHGSVGVRRQQRAAPPALFDSDRFLRLVRWRDRRP